MWNITSQVSMTDIFYSCTSSGMRSFVLYEQTLSILIQLLALSSNRSVSSFDSISWLAYVG